jgi:hypothetical protein
MINYLHLMQSGVTIEQLYVYADFLVCQEEEKNQENYTETQYLERLHYFLNKMQNPNLLD